MRVYFVVLLSFFLFACSEQKSEKKEEIKSVFVTYPKVKEENLYRVFNAEAYTEEEIKLSFKVQGSVKKLFFQLGDEVKKGELIALLDSKPYELKVSQIEYALNEAKAAFLNAKSNYERTKRLYINQNASASDIDSTKANYDVAIAKVKNVKKELEYAKLQLSYTKLNSPIDGYVSFRYVKENENVSIGTPVILITKRVIDKVSVQVPEVLINKIKEGESAKVIFSSLDELRSFSAKVSEISKYASNSSKTYRVIVKLNNSSKLIKVGMSADVYFDLSSNRDLINPSLLTLPSNSILNDKRGYFVYVLESKNQRYYIKRRDVEVLELTNDGFEVKEGLDIKDLVLKAGMSEVYEGMEVKIGNMQDLGK